MTHTTNVRKEVIAIWNKWLTTLGLGDWRILLVFDDTQSVTKAWPTLMCTDARWEYKRATITVYTQQCVGLKGNDLEECIVHELTHCLLAELVSQVPEDAHTCQHIERTVTQISRAFQWTRDKGRRESGKHVTRTVQRESTARTPVSAGR